MATINHKTYNEATETFKDFNVYDGKETLIFKVDGSEGNVGIGTADPQTILNDFSTSARGLAISNSYPLLGFSDTDGGKFFVGTQANIGYIWNNGTSDIIVATNAAERMRITSTGNVGIGTNSPSYKLDITAIGYGIQHYADASNSLRSYVGSTYQVLEATTPSGVSQFGYVSNNFYVEAGGSERMRITSAGNVGIGTSSPSNRVQSRRDATTDSSNSQFVAETRTGTVGQYAIYASRFDDGTGAGFTPIVFGAVQTAAAGRTGDFVVAVSNTDNVNLSTHERLRITSAGNVGIGTSTPASKLHIYDGDAFLGLDWASANYEATPRQFRIASNGNNSGYITQAAYNSSATAATTFFRSYVNAASSGALVFESGAGNFNTNSGIPTSYTESMRITSAGNVLLGSQQVLGVNTEDGSDNGYIALAGAGGDGVARGGHIYLSGNERTVDAGSIVLAGGTTSTGTGATAAIVFRTNGSERMRVLAAGGLTFNGDTAAANALDDYEEGTWTPVLVGAAVSGTYELGDTYAVYTKIGRQVTASMQIQLASSITGGGSGYAAIYGLPFVKIANAQFQGVCSFEGVAYSADIVTTEFTSPTGAVSTIYFRQSASNSSGSDLLISAFSADDVIKITLTYFV